MRKPDPDADAHRAELVGGLAGRVLEVGPGTGANFAFYPEAVTEVVAEEPEPYMRDRARRAAGEAPVPVTVGDAVADALPHADQSFDAVVCSLVLCSVPSQADALAELRRVLRPGGELRFYEHVLARDGRLARTQRTVTPIWRRVSGGCHPDRDTVAAIRAAGFEVERYRHFPFLPTRLVAPVAPHVLGVARRP